MSEHPLLMCGELVKATLAGQKTMTRRIIKPQPPEGWSPKCVNGMYDWICFGSKQYKCPYGKVGDLLWVREAYYKSPITNQIQYKAEGFIKGWQPISSIFMPKILARLWLEIINIRVEQVQSISEEDVKAEGVIVRNIGETYWRAFRNVWDSLNAKRGYGWDKNPWVWVIEYKVKGK